MRFIKLETGNIGLQQFEKIEEEYEEVYEALGNVNDIEGDYEEHDKQFVKRINLLIGELFDLKQATMQMILELTEMVEGHNDHKESYEKHYKAHLLKLDARLQAKQIKLDKVLEL